MTKFFGALVVSGLAMSASAQITAFNFVDVDNAAGGAALAGFTTTDISVDFDSRWTGSQMLIELTQGSIYQNAVVSGFGPPSAFALFVDPAAAFDTYLTLNARTQEDLPTSLRAFGGAVNLGGQAGITFSEDAVDAVWVYFPHEFPAGTTFDDFQDIDDFLVSRVSLSDDAQGTFKVLASAGGIISVSDIPTVASALSADAAFDAAASETDGLQVEGAIQGGAFIVPEPASAAALLMGLGVLLRRRSA